VDEFYKVSYNSTIVVNFSFHPINKRPLNANVSIINECVKVTRTGKYAVICKVAISYLI